MTKQAPILQDELSSENVFLTPRGLTHTIKNYASIKMIKVREYVNENLVFFYEGMTKEQVLREMVGQSSLVLPNADAALFYKAVCDRENLVSTGIGLGVAIPHAKLPSFDMFFIAIGISKTGIDWHSIDQLPVKIIFLIGGPDDKQTEYLQLLSSLTSLIRDEELRRQLTNATNAEEVLFLFEERNI